METNVKQLGQEIVEAWNSHDLDRILSHYSEDFELHSPLAAKILSIPDGIIFGKENVRVWWQRCLDKVPDLSFEFVDVAEGTKSMVLVQRSSHNNKVVVSNFFLNDKGLICKEIYFN
jgi:ketosteroid isomerase-like protein